MADVLTEERAHLILPAAAAGFLAAALVWLAPPGTDVAAHVYQRALYLQHGFVLWNNFWYAGRYSFVTYSVLYYPLAALLGIKLLAVATVATSVIACAAVVRHEWGGHGSWSIRAFAVVWAVLVLSGAYPFMLGSAFALGALSALQRLRRAVFAVSALGALAASPLAFLLLVVVLAGVALARRRDVASLIVPATAVAAIGAAELLLQRMFPGHGTFPFSTAEFAAAAAFCLIGIAMSWRVPRARVLRWLFVVYLVACSAAFAIASPIGENIARLRFVAVPLAVLTLSLRDWRPRLACIGAARLQRPRRGATPPQRSRPAEGRAANEEPDRFRRAVAEAARHPARPRAPRRLHVDSPCRPPTGHVPARRDVRAVLAHHGRLC